VFDGRTVVNGIWSATAVIKGDFKVFLSFGLSTNRCELLLTFFASENVSMK
jgi:hypothetical protein